MKTIRILYWMGTEIGQCDLMHNEVFDFTEANRNWIVGKILDAGLNLLIEQYVDGLRIWIDDRRFQQR